jgi:CubicO group peptidase (beta-lactamase class C family)
MRTESWADAVARVVATEPEPGWVPGRRAGYHLRGSFFLLGEIVRLLDGRPFDEYVRAEILEPLGMADSWVALPPDQYRRYADAGRMGTMYDTTGEAPRPIPSLLRDDAHVRCVPGGSGIGPAAELVRIAELLLGKGGPLLRPQTVEAMVARHRVDLVDETFGQRIDWGLGVMVNSWHYQQRPAPYGYGDHASARAFGHGGVQSSLCFADPEHGLAVALICNGMPGEAANHRRTQPVISALYRDFGLISG